MKDNLKIDNMEATKKVKMQDSLLKLAPAKSGETSINISNDILNVICGTDVDRPSVKDITFTLYKEDFVKGMCFILSHLPLYKSSSQGSKKIEFSMHFYNSYDSEIKNFFGEQEEKEYTCKLNLRGDGRSYLNNLECQNFSIRDFLVENSTQITFGRHDNDDNYIRLTYMTSSMDDTQKPERIFSVQQHCTFALKCMAYFYNSPMWSKIEQYVTDDFKLGDSIKLSAGKDASLTGMFKYVSEEKLTELNNPSRRWFLDPFQLKGKTVYLSTEWYPGDGVKKYSLEISKLTKFISKCFGKEFEVRRNEEENKWELWKVGVDNIGRKIVGQQVEQVEEQQDVPVPSVPFSIARMISLISDTGLLYSDQLIKRFAFSLMSKRFLILSGLAGSGKTQLALAFASALIKDESQMCVVPVGADWTNREPLLGFPNALQENQYVKPESGVLDLLIEANKPENSSKPYFLILDEMNMSYVERYFADFLSAMESHKAIPLWKGEGDVPQSICLPSNLFIVGTINVDETTYMFSPKVLDRANVIEFKISPNEMDTFLGEMKPIDRDSINYKAQDMAESFVTIATSKELADDKEIKVTLGNFFKDLKSVNAEFGYRSATEIYRFISQAQKNDDTEEKMNLKDILDCAIVQKLMPKLHGSRKKLDATLNALWKECFESDAQKETTLISRDKVTNAMYPLTADKILRMYDAAMANGFTSFSEA